MHSNLGERRLWNSPVPCNLLGFQTTFRYQSTHSLDTQPKSLRRFRDANHLHTDSYTSYKIYSAREAFLFDVNIAHALYYCRIIF
jgi:hypothetical protein